jgi:hypothetical protein
MRGIGVERDGAQRAASRIVVALEVPLEYQAPLAHNDDHVEIPNALLRDCLVEQRSTVGCEASFVGEMKCQPDPSAAAVRIDRSIRVPPIPTRMSGLLTTGWVV